MKNILIVVTDTNVGGVTTAAYNLMGELCKRGHKVSFLDFSAQEKNPHIPPEVTQVFLTGKARYWKLGASDIAAAKPVKKPFLLLLGMFKKLTIRSGLWNKLVFSKLKEHYDAAIAFRQCAPCYSFVLNKVSAEKKIGFVHGDLDFMGDISSWQPFMGQFDKIAYVSNTAKRHFIRKYPALAGNACTVYNMFDYASIKERTLEPLPFPLNATEKNIVTVARIDNSSKQIYWIPQICSILKANTNVRFHWYVLGDGPDMDEVTTLSAQRKTEDVLTFTGNISNPYCVLRQAYLGVLTSKTEGYPMTVIESLCLGLPMVCTNFESVTEQITHRVDGLVADLNLDAVAKSIQDMLENNDGIYDHCKDALSKRVFNNDLPYEQFMESIR